MKFATTICVAAAPLAMARRVVPPEVEGKLDARSVTVLKGMQGAGITDDALTEVVIVWANAGNGASSMKINREQAVNETGSAGAGGAPPSDAQGDGRQGGTTTIKQGESAALASKGGATHIVKVGGSGGLTYQPEQLNNVPVGDTVIFEFLSNNHSTTQTSFEAPCVPLGGGMDSGFLPNPNNTLSPPPRVAMQVMTTNPIWFYCRQKGHCGKGMVFSINPTAEKTHAMFQGLAIKQNGSGAGTPITAGQQKAPPPAEASKPAGAGAPKEAAAKQAPAMAEMSSEAPAGGQDKQPDGPKGTGTTQGKGVIGPDGSCTCVVSCMPGGFPAAQAQGVGAVGGMGGALPIMGSMS